MTRLVGWLSLLLVLAWVLAHLLSLRPLREATEVTLVGGVWLAVASALVAALTVLGFGLAAGRTRPAWLRFVGRARTAAAGVGCALIVVGLIHYRDTEPQSEIHWIVLGLAVLIGAGLVHWWVIRTARQAL
jgi:hypothetical protein